MLYWCCQVWFRGTGGLWSWWTSSSLISVLVLSWSSVTCARSGYDPILSLLAKYPSYSSYFISRSVQGVSLFCATLLSILFSKRNGGVPDECRGRYDTAIYTTLDNICEDCYNLYKEPDIHSMCRWFTIFFFVLACSCSFLGLIASVVHFSKDVSKHCCWKKTDMWTWHKLLERDDENHVVVVLQIVQGVMLPWLCLSILLVNSRIKAMEDFLLLELRFRFKCANNLSNCIWNKYFLYFLNRSDPFASSYLFFTAFLIKPAPTEYKHSGILPTLYQGWKWIKSL